MPPTVPTIEPRSAYSADTWEWDKTLADYLPSDGWQLSYRVVGPVVLDIVWGTHVTASGDVFEVRVPASVTNALIPGFYTLVGSVTDGTPFNRTIVDERFEVLPDFADAVAAEDPTKIRIDALVAAIASLEAGRLSASIDGRSYTNFQIPELEGRLRRLKTTYQFKRFPKYSAPSRELRFVE